MKVVFSDVGLWRILDFSCPAQSDTTKVSRVRQRCLVVSCHRAPAAPQLRFARIAHVLALLGRTCAFPYLDIVRLHSGRLHVRVPSVLRPGGDLMVKLDSRRNGVPSPMLVSLLRRSTPLPVVRPSPARRILGARPFSYLAKQRLHQTLQ